MIRADLPQETRLAPEPDSRDGLLGELWLLVVGAGVAYGLLWVMVNGALALGEWIRTL